MGQGGADVGRREVQVPGPGLHRRRRGLALGLGEADHEDAALAVVEPDVGPSERPDLAGPEARERREGEGEPLGGRGDREELIHLLGGEGDQDLAALVRERGEPRHGRGDAGVERGAQDGAEDDLHVAAPRGRGALPDELGVEPGDVGEGERVDGALAESREEPGGEELGVAPPGAGVEAGDGLAGAEEGEGVGEGEGRGRGRLGRLSREGLSRGVGSEGGRGRGRGKRGRGEQRRRRGGGRRRDFRARLEEIAVLRDEGEQPALLRPGGRQGLDLGVLPVAALRAVGLAVVDVNDQPRFAAARCLADRHDRDSSRSSRPLPRWGGGCHESSR